MNGHFRSNPCEQSVPDGRRLPTESHPATGTACAHGSAGASQVAFVRHAKNGATFIFRRRLPEGMTREEARRRCEDAIRALAEGVGR